MSIDDFKVEPATQQCLTDVFTFDHPTPATVDAAESGERPFSLPHDPPINFYDNDDGFWDNHIREKHLRGEESGLSLIHI